MGDSRTMGLAHFDWLPDPTELQHCSEARLRTCSAIFTQPANGAVEADFKTVQLNKQNKVGPIDLTKARQKKRIFSTFAPCQL